MHLARPRSDQWCEAAETALGVGRIQQCGRPEEREAEEWGSEGTAYAVWSAE